MIFFVAGSIQQLPYENSYIDMYGHQRYNDDERKVVENEELLPARLRSNTRANVQLQYEFSSVQKTPTTITKANVNKAKQKNKNK